MKKILTILMLLFSLSLTLMAINTHSYDMANCVGYWSLNENSLNSAQAFTDLSGNGNLGISANVPTFSADQNGIGSQAMVFNGSSDVVNLESAITFDDGYSLSIWFKWNVTNINIDCLLGGNLTNNNYLSLYNDSGILKILMKDVDSNDTFSAVTIGTKDEQWHNLIITNGSTPIAYLDGINAGTGIQVGAYSFNKIGNGRASGYFFNGSLSDILIYNTALTSDQVSKLYEAGRSTATVEMDGRELVTNGGFDTDSGWTKLNGSTISVGVANVIGDGLFGSSASNWSLNQPAVFGAIGKTYIVTFDARQTVGSGNFLMGTGYTIRFNETITGSFATYSTNVTTSLVVSEESSLTLVFGGVTIGDEFEIDNISVIDITNAITYPTTTGNLVLDMPLCDPYAEGGDNLISSTLVNLNYDTFDGASSSGFHAIRSTSATQICGTVDEIPFVLDRKYAAIFDATLTSGQAPNVVCATALNSGTVTEIQAVVSGHNVYKFAPDETTTGVLEFYNTGNSEFTISNLSITELNATTKDLSYSQSDGAVNGATIQYDGLANVSAGIAYVPSDVAYGEWEFLAYNGFGVPNIVFISDSKNGYENSNGYYFGFNYNSGGIFIGRTNIGSHNTLMFDTDADADTMYGIKITRTEAGVFTVYIKGGAFGWDSWTIFDPSGGSGTNPVTDNTYTSSSYFVADLDASDTISDLHINGNPISLQSATQSTGSWTTTAPSYDFNGTTDYIDLGADEPTDLTGDITISCWIRPEGWGENTLGYVLRSRGIAYFGVDDDVFNTNCIAFSSSGSYPIKSGNNSISLNEWQHVLITRPSAGTNTNIYINGVLSGTANQNSGTPSTGTTNTFIGNNDAGTRTFDGQIKGLKIWNRLLSTTEITYEYNTSWRR